MVSNKEIMELKETLLKNKKYITMFLITGMLFARCNLGLYYGGIYVLINLIFNGLAVLYLGLLFTKDKAPVKKTLISPAFVWIVLFSTMVFIYGHFKLFTAADYYSRMITIMTALPAILILMLLFYNKEDVMDVLAVSGSVVIITTLITSLCYDYVWGEWLMGMYSRVGATPAGGVIDTGNLVLILLLPVMYQVIILRKIKQYLWISIIGVFEILATGAKSSVFPIVFVFAIMILGASDDKKVVRRNLIILVVAAVVAFIAIMTIPPLYGVVGYRIAELFTGVKSAEPDLHTSTGQRMAMIAGFKEHFWEAPLFGHGFYSFREMPYSAIEEYRVGTEIAYRNVQLHMNYMEVLFSYGIVGFVLYYWFPVYIIIRAIKANKMAKIMIFSIMISFVFMDLGIDMYYKYLLPYYSYFLAYFFLEKDKQS